MVPSNLMILFCFAILFFLCPFYFLRAVNNSDRLWQPVMIIEALLLPVDFRKTKMGWCKRAAAHLGTNGNDWAQKGTKRLYMERLGAVGNSWALMGTVGHFVFTGYCRGWYGVATALLWVWYGDGRWQSKTT